MTVNGILIRLLRPLSNRTGIRRHTAGRHDPHHGGGFRFGSGGVAGDVLFDNIRLSELSTTTVSAGNHGDGIHIENSSGNLIGGSLPNSVAAESEHLLEIGDTSLSLSRHTLGAFPRYSTLPHEFEERHSPSYSAYKSMSQKPQAIC